MASWFSTLEALAASKTTPSLSMSFVKTCNLNSVHHKFQVPTLGYFIEVGLKVSNLDEALVDGKLIEGEGSCLVTAEDIHASHLFYSSHPLCDGSLL